MDLHSSDRAELDRFAHCSFHRRTHVPNNLLVACVAIITASCVCFVAKADVPTRRGASLTTARSPRVTLLALVAVRQGGYSPMKT